MTRRRALLLGALSTALLVVVGLAWPRGDGRADLEGAPVDPAPNPPADVTEPPREPPPLPAPEPRPVEVPVRLRIPSLGVDSTVEPVGLEPDGSMEIPGVTAAGWYLHGPRPGTAGGSAVIAAHVDYGGQPGVFFELRRLEAGEEVDVLDAAGVEHTFVVTERFQVDKDSLPIPELFRVDGDPVLTLITCGGVFDRGARSYEDNIVVRAVPT